jgi:hypothetical protein
MKLSRLFMIALLAGTLGVLGCGDDETNPAGSGGSGTAGTGGSGTAGTGGGGGGGMCDATAEEVCATCDAVDRIPACESRFDACLVDPPSGNYCEKCGLAAIEECGAV